LKITHKHVLKISGRIHVTQHCLGVRWLGEFLCN